MKRIVLVTAVALAASGAFASGERPADALFVNASAVSLSTFEATYSKSLHDVIGATQSYARGFSGKGVVVTVMDTGVDANYAEFNGKLVTGTQYNGASTGKWGAATDPNGHGTHVAGLIAAQAGSGITYGIAPEAQIYSLQVMGANGTGNVATITQGLKLATANTSSPIINMSIGATGSFGTDFEAALQAALRAGKLVVVAAGNSSAANPEWPAQYANAAWANGQILVVGAVDTSKGNTIATFSNRAGNTANHFLVAPGVNILSTFKGGTYAYMSGTSMAAPIVSGVAALIEGAWPFLKAQQVESILLVTATDLGAKGVDPIYGYGMVNADAATSPVGAVTVRLSNGVVVAGTGLSATLGRLGSALTKMSAGVTDSYNRYFPLSNGTAMAPAAPMKTPGMPAATATPANPIMGGHFTELYAVDGSGTTVENRLGQTSLFVGMGNYAGYAFGLRDAGTENPLLSLAGPGAHLGVRILGLDDSAWTFGMVATDPLTTPDPLNAVPLQHNTLFMGEYTRKAGSLTYLTGVSVLKETNGVLGTQGGAALGLDRGALTTALQEGLGYALSDYWSLNAQATVARSQLNTANLVVNTPAIITASASVSLVGQHVLKENDRFAMSLGQPSRIVAGHMDIVAPTSQNADGSLNYTSQRLSLAATSPETRFNVGYASPLTKVSSLGLGASIRYHPDNLTDAPTQYAAQITYTKKF